MGSNIGFLIAYGADGIANLAINGDGYHGILTEVYGKAFQNMIKLNLDLLPYFLDGRVAEIPAQRQSSIKDQFRKQVILLSDEFKPAFGDW